MAELGFWKSSSSLTNEQNEYKGVSYLPFFVIVSDARSNGSHLGAIREILRKPLEMPTQSLVITSSC